MPHSYHGRPPGGPAGLLRPGQVPIVLADCNGGVYSPALNALLCAGSPAARATLRDIWIAVLVAHGVERG